MAILISQHIVVRMLEGVACVLSFSGNSMGV